MKAAVKSILKVAFAMILLLPSGCVHKDVSEVFLAGQIQVVFDWRKAPDAKASSMLLYLYSEEYKVAKYWFDNPTGGIIKAYPGAHTGICHDNDDSYSLLIRNHETHDQFEIYTETTKVLTGQGIATRSIPRAPGTEDEPLRSTPSMCYGTHDRNIYFAPISGLQTLTFYPEELVSHYTVEFIGVENLNNADLRIDGSITSLAGGYYPGRLMATNEPVTYTFTVSADENLTTLKTEFLTFGVPSEGERKHMVSVYIVTKNRSGNVYTFDVTDQIKNAPDPKHVYIKIYGLKLPEIDPDDPPDDPGDRPGMGVDIDDWKTQYFDIKV